MSEAEEIKVRKNVGSVYNCNSWSLRGRLNLINLKTEYGPRRKHSASAIKAISECF